MKVTYLDFLIYIIHVPLLYHQDMFSLFFALYFCDIVGFFHIIQQVDELRAIIDLTRPDKPEC